MTRTLCATTLVLAAMAAVGCNSTEYDRNAADFDPERSRTRAILNAQYAKGAAEDAALTPHHFDGTALNGLGRDKLDRMLAHGRPQTLVVHVDARGLTPQESEPMLASVRGYLKASGVQVTDNTVVLGPSPRSTSASETLAGVKRLDKRSDTRDTAPGASNVAANQDSLFSER